jgi:hypothetical protein
LLSPKIVLLACKGKIFSNFGKQVRREKLDSADNQESYMESPDFSQGINILNLERVLEEECW